MKILIVDDNGDTIKTYTRALMWHIEPRQSDRDGSMIDVENAETVSMALKKLSSNKPELLVVDLKIPGLAGEEMGGVELIDESLKLDPLRPIIAITGFGSIQLARKTLTQGVFDFIEKSSTAVDDLVKAVQRAIDGRAERTLRSGNPFTPMSGIEPTVFGGRTKELEFFEQRINRTLNANVSEHFLVLGDWGIGKSTLFKEYKKLCQSRGYLAAVVPLESMQTGAKLIEAARSVVESILRDLPFPVDRLKKVTSFFDSIGISIFGTGLNFSRDTSKKDLSAQAFLHDTLIHLWDDVKDKTDVLVILLDDLDNFAAVSEVVMTLKQTLSMDSVKKTKILVGLSSTETNWLALTSIKKHHPLSRYFLSRVELSPLSSEEMRDTILKSVSGTGVSIASEVVDRVFEYTDGHPFEMQVLCYHLFNNQLSRRVEVEVWEKSLESTINDLGIAVFGHWFAQASAEKAKVLGVVAGKESPMAVKQIQASAIERKLKISAGGMNKYLQRLVEKRLVAKSGRGHYSVPDKMFRSYIRSLSL